MRLSLSNLGVFHTVDPFHILHGDPFHTDIPFIRRAFIFTCLFHWDLFNSEITWHGRPLPQINVTQWFISLRDLHKDPHCFHSENPFTQTPLWCWDLFSDRDLFHTEILFNERSVSHRHHLLGQSCSLWDPFHAAIPFTQRPPFVCPYVGGAVQAGPHPLQVSALHVQRAYGRRDPHLWPIPSPAGWYYFGLWRHHPWEKPR